MKKKQVIVLGILFGLALSGLVAIQFGYYRQAFGIRQQQYAFTVNKSMDEVLEFIREKNRQHIESHAEKWIFQADGQIGSSPFLQDKALVRSMSAIQQQLHKTWGNDYSLVVERETEQECRVMHYLDKDDLERIIYDRLEENQLRGTVEFAVREGEKYVISSTNFFRYTDIETFCKKIFPGQGEDSPVLYCKFPGHSSDMMGAFYLMLPALIIIFALVGCAVFCIVIIVRQKKLSTIKNDFISNMTHEFKTPLATISLAAQMLKDGAVSNTPEGLGQVATIIRDESKRLTMLVERILQTALFEENRVKLKLKKVNINQIISEFFPKLALRVAEKGGCLNLDLKAERDEVQADVEHITNVLSNLIDNAIKYSGRSPEVSIRTENVAQGIRISVIDNGIGISKKDQKLIFERFFRVPTGNLHDVKGFGLGLSFVKKIVEEHGGTVEVDSTLQKGSRFDIILPYSGKKAID